jgi:lichenan operon transcriptional antiterminator
MMKRVTESFVIDLNPESLYSEMSNHLFYLINRSIFYTEPKEMFFGEVEEKYPFPYEIAKVATAAIGEKINRQIDSTEIDYLTLYFEMALRGSTIKKKLNVAVISNTGLGTIRLIRRQIDSVVGEGTSFTQFTEENYMDEDLSDYFVIFTTIPLKNAPKGVPVIRISNILSEQWLSNELEKVINTNPHLINETLYGMRSLNEEKDYLENLEILMEPMEKEGIITEEFKKRIIKREEKQKTIFDNGIAFPHEINPNSEKISLMLGVFTEDYIVDYQEVKAIFLLAVPDNLTLKSENKILELYDLIFRLANDNTFKKDIAAINNRSEAVEYLEDRRLL